MPNKLTDAEVKKAFECCSTYHDVSSCQNCPLDGKCEPNILEQYALDLINRREGEKEKNENIIRIADKTIATLQAENESLKAEIERLKEDIKILRVSVEQAPLIRKDGKSPLSLLTAEIKAEAYKEFAERSEKEIFIKQEDERKQMLKILKTYRGTRNYSDTEQSTDNWLRGYGEAVQDVLGVFYNLLNELVSDGDDHE